MVSLFCVLPPWFSTSSSALLGQGAVTILLTAMSSSSIFCNTFPYPEVFSSSTDNGSRRNWGRAMIFMHSFFLFFFVLKWAYEIKMLIFFLLWKLFSVSINPFVWFGGKLLADPDWYHENTLFQELAETQTMPTIGVPFRKSDFVDH